MNADGTSKKDCCPKASAAQTPAGTAASAPVKGEHCNH
jgi:hypothetical protein